MANAKILTVVALSCVAGFAWAINKIPEPVTKDIHHRFHPNKNLGDRIQQTVYEGLRPLRNMQFMFKVQSGTGGVTVAQFADKTFIVRDGALYECDGTISDKDGSCSGSTTRFKLENKSDYCYIPVTVQLNNWYCITSDGTSIKSGILNNEPYCESNSGDALIISTSEYQSLCQSKDVTYTYFTYDQVEDHGPEVQCEGENPTICVLHNQDANVIG